MKSVQFDENINAKHLRNACAEEGLICPLPFPPQLRSKKDPEVLATLLPKNNLILTLDRCFIEDHAAHVPDAHAGVLVVEQDVHTIGTMTTRKAQRILADFKESCPDWPTLDCRNSIVCITQTQIEILHVTSGNLESDGGWFSRSDAGWRELLLTSLSTNASRSATTTSLPDN